MKTIILMLLTCASICAQTPTPTATASDAEREKIIADIRAQQQLDRAIKEQVERDYREAMLRQQIEKEMREGKITPTPTATPDVLDKAHWDKSLPDVWPDGTTSTHPNKR